MPQRDLYGDHIPVKYAVDACAQASLFTQAGGTGSAWMRRAQEWADVHHLRIVHWQADQVFHVLAPLAPEGTQPAPMRVFRNDLLPGGWQIESAFLTRGES